jgi:predicted CXXCH cytochrome family protein
MSASLKAGRRPWLDEPNCASCHGPAYSTGSTLFRKAKGHGGVLCVACHNSPHAWYPSLRSADNAQPLALQNSNHAIGYQACYICHNDGRTGTVPPHEDD